MLIVKKRPEVSFISILTTDVLLKVFILLFALILLLILNIYLFISRKRNIYSVFFHILSFCLIVFLFCILLQTAIIELDIEKYYVNIGQVALYIGTFLLFITILLSIVYYRKISKKVLILPNLIDVFMSIDDIAIICDYKGDIVEINKSPKQKQLFGEKCYNVDDLLSILIKKAPIQYHNEIKTVFYNLKSFHQIELEFKDTEDFYLINISPIMPNKNNCIGATIVFHNIKKEKLLIREIDKQNLSLQKANNKLLEYVRIANDLETEKERLRLLQEIQADLIDKIEIVISNIKKIQNNNFQNICDYQNSISEISKELRDVYNEVRQSINSISLPNGGADIDKNYSS